MIRDYVRMFNSLELLSNPWDLLDSVLVAPYRSPLSDQLIHTDSNLTRHILTQSRILSNPTLPTQAPFTFQHA